MVVLRCSPRLLLFCIPPSLIGRTPCRISRISLAVYTRSGFRGEPLHAVTVCTQLAAFLFRKPRLQSARRHTFVATVPGGRDCAAGPTNKYPQPSPHLQKWHSIRAGARKTIKGAMLCTLRLRCASVRREQVGGVEQGPCCRATLNDDSEYCSPDNHTMSVQFLLVTG